MSTQIAVHLSDDAVAFVDEQVALGAAVTRADYISRAVEREQRRVAAERDLDILRTAVSEDDADDLDALAEYSARLPRPELD